ncbi:MAG: hypothetical protein JW947_05885 [Sedimentisphaerales bacterium]|nr:hypothetical protein [Sedimentisphaerales bacterium]
MKKIFTLLTIGIVFLPACFSAKKTNCLPKRDSTEGGMYLEGFEGPIDFNNVTGYVGITVPNIPPEANKVFIFVDEVQVGNWVRGWYGFVDDNSFSWPRCFESNRFSNGWHRIKLVSVDYDGTAKNYPPIDAYFKNLLYNVRCDDRFSPNENYHYRGFYDGKKSLEVKLTNCRGEVLWSNTYSGNYIDVNIPASAFEKEQLCNIDVNEIQGCSKETNLVVYDCNEKLTKTSIEFFQADKYFVPPKNETVAILLYPSCVGNESYKPLVLFGDKKLAEKLMGKSLEPEKIIEGREWLEKIMNAYSAAIEEAKKKHFHRQGYEFMGQIIFVTAKKGYMQQIDVDVNTVYNNYMESGVLKTYFDELGLTKELLAGEPNKVVEH